MKKLLYIATGIFFMLQSCGGGYSFTGGSVGEAETLSVEYFLNRAPLVNPDLSQYLTEAIKDIFIQQTRLELKDGNSDLLVQGIVTGYDVQPMSAQGNETTSQSRFTIAIRVTFTNSIEPEKSYEASFSRFRDFSSDNLFTDVENQLAVEIVQELAEDIMNKAIADW